MTEFILPALELTLQGKTESGSLVLAALTRPGGFLPLGCEGRFTVKVPNRTQISRT